MRKTVFIALALSVLVLGTGAARGTAFDERLWEKYSEIEVSGASAPGALTGVYLEPYVIGDETATPPFADLRLVTEKKEEVPWEIVAQRPERQREDVPARMQNLSRSQGGETWLELVVGKQNAQVNAVEVITPDTDFSRQVKVLGSPDGKQWSTIRNDGVIFDVQKGEKARHTRITFSPSSFRYLALQIENGDAAPLEITGAKVLQDDDRPGQTYTVEGKTEKSESKPGSRESSVTVRMERVFPVDRFVVATPEKNFQRSVEVQVKRENGEWERWAQGTVFSFETPAVHESQLAVEIPEITAKEFRLVFRNLDSPPLTITGVSGEGYRRLLVFKKPAGRKLYLFWGNPKAQPPHYDLAGLVARQKLDELPRATLGPMHGNSKFAGNDARLPFTERYKQALYAVVALAVAGLIFLQYRVFKRVEE